MARWYDYYDSIEPGALERVEALRPLVEKYFPGTEVERALYVIYGESRGVPTAQNPDSGASGLMQFMPGTAEWVGLPWEQRFDPEANIAAAARLLTMPGGGWQHWDAARFPGDLGNTSFINNTTDRSVEMGAPLPPAAGTGTATGGGGPVLPVDGSFTITQIFGPTSVGLDSGWGQYPHFSRGVDFGVPVGTAVASTTGGTVIAVGDQGDGWGYSVKVRDQNGLIHNFGHLSGASVNVGDAVQAGQPIAVSGNTGKGDGPHLSYDVYQPDGTPVDPSPWLGFSAFTTNDAVTDPAVGMTANDVRAQFGWPAGGSVDTILVADPASGTLVPGRFSETGYTTGGDASMVVNPGAGGQPGAPAATPNPGVYDPNNYEGFIQTYGATYSEWNGLFSKLSPYVDVDGNFREGVTISDGVIYFSQIKIDADGQPVMQQVQTGVNEFTGEPIYESQPVYELQQVGTLDEFNRFRALDKQLAEMENSWANAYGEESLESVIELTKFRYDADPRVIEAKNAQAEWDRQIKAIGEASALAREAFTQQEQRRRDMATESGQFLKGETRFVTTRPVGGFRTLDELFAQALGNVRDELPVVPGLPVPDISEVNAAAARNQQNRGRAGDLAEARSRILGTDQPDPRTSRSGSKAPPVPRYDVPEGGTAFDALIPEQQGPGVSRSSTQPRAARAPGAAPAIPGASPPVSTQRGFITPEMAGDLMDDQERRNRYLSNAGTSGPDPYNPYAPGFSGPRIGLLYG